MNKIEKSIQVELPVQVVYDQWTQFEEFSKFKEFIESRGTETGAWRGVIHEGQTLVAK